MQMADTDSLEISQLWDTVLALQVSGLAIENQTM